jgi:hypothetical protein
MNKKNQEIRENIAECFHNFILMMVSILGVLFVLRIPFVAAFFLLAAFFRLFYICVKRVYQFLDKKFSKSGLAK